MLRVGVGRSTLSLSWLPPVGRLPHGDESAKPVSKRVLRRHDWAADVVLLRALVRTAGVEVDGASTHTRSAPLPPAAQRDRTVQLGLRIRSHVLRGRIALRRVSGAQLHIRGAVRPDCE